MMAYLINTYGVVDRSRSHPARSVRFSCSIAEGSVYRNGLGMITVVNTHTGAPQARRLACGLGSANADYLQFSHLRHEGDDTVRREAHFDFPHRAIAAHVDDLAAAVLVVADNHSLGVVVFRARFALGF